MLFSIKLLYYSFGLDNGKFTEHTSGNLPIFFFDFFFHIGICWVFVPKAKFLAESKSVLRFSHRLFFFFFMSTLPQLLALLDIGKSGANLTIKLCTLFRRS